MTVIASIFYDTKSTTYLILLDVANVALVFFFMYMARLLNKLSKIKLNFLHVTSSGMGRY